MNTEHIAMLVKHAKMDDIIRMLSEALDQYEKAPGKESLNGIIFVCTALLSKNVSDEIGTDALIKELQDGRAAIKAFSLHKNKN